MDTLERIVDEIENLLQNSLDREVSSQRIGTYAMEKLKNVDEVAYVRLPRCIANSRTSTASWKSCLRSSTAKRNNCPPTRVKRAVATCNSPFLVVFRSCSGIPVQLAVGSFARKLCVEGPSGCQLGAHQTDRRQGTWMALGRSTFFCGLSPGKDTFLAKVMWGGTLSVR